MLSLSLYYGMKRTTCITLCLVFALCIPQHSTALDSLIVGEGVTNGWWRSVRKSSERVNVTFDSIFRWDVEARANLSPKVLSRKGSISVWDSLKLTAPSVTNLLDGNPLSAYNPDVHVDVPRTAQIVIFLGDVYRINRIRLFPRLDSEHRQLFPQKLRVSTKDSGAGPDEGFDKYLPISPLTFTSFNQNQEPVIDRTFLSRDATHVRLWVESGTPWELAEFEIYSDGSLPPGRFTSKPLFTAGRLNPIWGRVCYDGGDIKDLPIILQTRTGPEGNPIQYFRRTGVGDDVVEVDAGIYSVLPEEEQGGVRSNPEWSSWETVTNSIIRSPDLNRYIQFRLFFPEPGVVLRQLIFEYTSPSIVKELQAEIDPRVVSVGSEQQFTVSLVAHMLTSRIKSQAGSTGFRRIRVQSGAAVTAIDRVLVDDEEISFSTITEEDGFTVTLGRRIAHDAAFLQIEFRGIVFRDATRFEVQVVDKRVVRGRLETVYQNAQDGDVDPLSVGGQLLVRIDGHGEGLHLLGNALSSPPMFTPNGDGINDNCTISYDLFKLTSPSVVKLDIFDIAGRLRRQLYRREDMAGHFEHVWNGVDDSGNLVPPGLYIFRATAEGGGTRVDETGYVGVVY